MSNIFNEIRRENAWEGYIESKDYENDLIEAAEKWVEKSKENKRFADDVFTEKLAEYDLSPLILNTENTIIEDARRETLLWIGEEKCAEHVKEKWDEEPCYDY